MPGRRKILFSSKTPLYNLTLLTLPWVCVVWLFWQQGSYGGQFLRLHLSNIHPIHWTHRILLNNSTQGWPASQLTDHEDRAGPFNSCYSSGQQHVFCLFSISFCHTDVLPPSSLPSTNSKRTPSENRQPFWPLSPAFLSLCLRMFQNTCTQHTLCTNKQKIYHLWRTAINKNFYSSWALSPRRAASASEPLKNPSLSETTCKKTTIHNDYPALSLIVYHTLFMRPIFLFILVRCHL